MYDQRQLRSKKVSWLYSVTLGPFGFIAQIIQFIKVWALIKTNRYKFELWIEEVDSRWVLSELAKSESQSTAPGIYAAMPSTEAVSTPAITRAAMVAILSSDMVGKSADKFIECITSWEL